MKASDRLKISMKMNPSVQESTPEQIQSKKEYVAEIIASREKKPELKINTTQLKILFKKTFEAEYRTELIVDQERQPIYNLMAQYFAQDPEFEKTGITENIPSLEKGILLIGKYGCGKTAMINTFHKIGYKLLPSKFMWFMSTSTLLMVDEFESLGDGEKGEFFNKYNNTLKIYFDDFGTEENASNYGKKNLMREVLEKRYLNNTKSFLTSNLSLQEINEKYGRRVFDRAQKQFNIIMMPGESFRK